VKRIAHISDLHFGRTDPAVVEGLLSELNGTRPDLVIITGDFTMRARHSEWEEARAFLARILSPWIAVPGNHDITAYYRIQRFIHPFRLYKRYISPDPEPVWKDDEIAVVCLNTARRWAFGTDWSEGRISRGQIARAEKLLDAFPDHLFRIVVGHHPFLPPPWDPESRIVGRADLALAAFERHGVRLALAGHLHRCYSRFAKPVAPGKPESERVDVPGETTGRRLLVVQAGSATSTRLRGTDPNAYNCITVEDGRATVEVRLWAGTQWRSADTALSEAKETAARDREASWTATQPASESERA
jgi:3',5'-cyclic AMP phosphodiesterase CpdA